MRNLLRCTGVSHCQVFPAYPISSASEAPRAPSSPCQTPLNPSIANLLSFPLAAFRPLLGVAENIGAAHSRLWYSGVSLPSYWGGKKGTSFGHLGISFRFSALAAERIHRKELHPYWSKPRGPERHRQHRPEVIGAPIWRIFLEPGGGEMKK